MTDNLKENTSWQGEGQDTCFKDIDWKEILVWDIFWELWWDRERPDEYEIHWVVVYDNDFGCYAVEQSNWWWMELEEYLQDIIRGRRVIWNIYQNPELLSER